MKCKKPTKLAARQEAKRLAMREQLCAVASWACMRSRLGRALFTAGSVSRHAVTPEGVIGWRLDKSGDYVYRWEEMGTGDLEFFLGRTYEPAPPIRSPLEILAAQV